MSSYNVIIFGASGSGKSSIVNMLSKTPVADVSDGADGCTFRSSPFKVNISGQPVTIWDTAGFDEGETGTVPNSDAIVQLYTLIRSLSDGVSLLMFVMRAPRIKSSVPQNWKIFQGVICQWRVPTVIVVTGLEELEDRDQWWQDNKSKFQAYGIVPAGYACITATRGKARGSGFVFDEEYEESQEAVRELILSKSLPLPWQVPAADWFKSTFIAAVVRRVIGKELAGEALKKLVKICKMSKGDAKELAKKMRNADVR